MNIFIDTNIFLSFYHLTNDDLEELRKLKALLESGQVVLYLPEQTIDEFRRNRETKIAAAMKHLDEQKLNFQFPAFCRDYEEYDVLQKHKTDLEKSQSFLVEKINKDIESHSLKADHVIGELFDKAKIIRMSPNFTSKAKLRMDIGNPPGKNGSLGDAIIWESLLEYVPNSKVLHFITEDRDYFSLLQKDKPKEFLLREWRQKKDSELFFYRHLAAFFGQHYPAIKFASEIEQELTMQEFVLSGSFETTHNAIAKLKGYKGFTKSQVNKIVDAALVNSQVYWILGDRNVFNFMTKISKDYKEKIDEESYNELVRSLKESEPHKVVDDGFPL